MANFIGLVYATLKENGIDTKGMSTDEAVAKFKELQGEGKEEPKKDMPEDVKKKLGEKKEEKKEEEPSEVKDKLNGLPQKWSSNEKFRKKELERLNITEDTLDDGYDYKTKEVKWTIAGAIPSRDGIFDTDTLGGFSGYDKDLANKENIVYMTPYEYLEKCAEGFGNTLNHQIKQIEANEETLNHLYNVIYNKNKRFPMPYIDFNKPSNQEGRHRMYVAGKILGFERKFPVLAVNNSKPK